ncbi:hypothetical protein D0Z00_004357 [Geotrichum galactomycetum]|uniref:Uncharacterized protein n=1 Tax=Geotrichum galactomycetum TaxID=27317 RepID=A0ACB6UYL5_9ASCO|nr:hypothetical protein D0Z00_004357 [Geotrichum candidum]
MPSLHLPGRHQRHPSLDSRMHYPTKALYTVDGYLKEDSELQIIHDSIVTADLSDEEDEQRFNQELYRTALKEAKKSTYYQQRANNDASAAIRSQLNEQRLRKQLHSLQSEWAQQASSRRRAEHAVSMDPAPMAEPNASSSRTRKSRRRPHGAQDFVVIKGQDLERLQSISSRKPTNDKQNEYYSFHDDYMMERERERQRQEEEERRKNRWVIDDKDIVQPYDDYKFSNRSTEQLPQQQQQLSQQTQQVTLQPPSQYQQNFPEQFHLPMPPPALSHSPVSSRSDHSVFHSQASTNSTHSLFMPPPLTLNEDTSSSSSGGGNSSPEIDHHSDGGALFSDQYGDCEEECESVLPLVAVQQTQLAASPKPKLNPPHQSPSAVSADLTINNDGNSSSSSSSSSISAKSLAASLNSRAISGGPENRALQDTSQPSVDHQDLPPHIFKSNDSVVSRLEKQASVLFKPSSSSSSSFPSSSSSSSPPPSSFLSSSSSSFVSAIDDTSTIKPHPHQRGNYASSKMSTDPKVSAFSAKGIYGRFSKKKTSTPRVQSSLDNPQLSRRQVAPSQKSYAPSVPSYREPYAPSIASTVTPRHRQPQPLTNYAQSVYAASTDTRSLNSYASRKGELHVPIPLNNSGGYSESRRTVRAAPVEMPEPQNRFAAAAAAAAAAQAQTSSQQQAVDYGEKFYDAWQSTKQMFQDWATAKVSLIVLVIYILLHYY